MSEEVGGGEQLPNLDDAPQTSESVKIVPSVVTSVNRPEQGLAWQVWQPVPLAFVAAIASQLMWVQIASFFDLTSEWWDTNGILLFSGNLLVCLFFLSSLKWYKNWGERFRVVFSSLCTISISLCLVLFGGIFCWPVLITVWALITAVWGRYNLSPWRNGVWLGVGGSVALLLASILVFVFI